MKICIKNANLFDGTGSSLKKNVFLIIEDKKIKKIGNNFSSQNTDNMKVIDAKGKYIIPGLIDSHIHCSFSGNPNMVKEMVEMSDLEITMLTIKNFQKLLKYGVTFIRDVGEKNYIVNQLKKYVLNGSIAGPGILSAGEIITMTGGHGDLKGLGCPSDGITENTKAARKQLKNGADLLKVIATGGVMTPGVDVNAYQSEIEEMAAVVHEAHKVNKTVAVHAHGTQGIKNAVKANVDSIEHCTLLDEEGKNMIIEKGIFVVPTLSAVYNITQVNPHAVPKESLEKALEVEKAHYKSLKMLYKAGAKIAMGTDAGTPFNEHGKSALLELELLEKAGIPPKEVLTIATKNSSELLKIDKNYGTLEPGKFADFIILDADPTKNISNVRKILQVFKHGAKI